MVGLLSLAIGTPAEASGPHAKITVTGSSWAGPAIEQWRRDTNASGIQVSWSPSGSAQGRKDFAADQNDFAVSDIGFLGTDPVTGASDTSQGRAFAYLPIVAGGTALPYHINKNGGLIKTLRLSGSTIAKIFTNQITNWDDNAITQDNNGVQMPNLPIVPVVHSEGSGSSYQFTRYLWKQYPSMWTNYAGNYATEYFPRQGTQVAEDGSDSVMSFIKSTNGAIGYDEYAYALAKQIPAAKVLNPGGYYTLPNQYNVAVALTKAQINMSQSSPDYLLQILDDVYTYNDVRSYPISSYSYAIIPTASNDPTMTTAKRKTIADYLYYSICDGQGEMGVLGYSSLPLNLVQASFAQVDKLHAADSGVDLSGQDVSTCRNPTFDRSNPGKNLLAEKAVNPPACDKQGEGPCTTTVDTGLTNHPGSNNQTAGSGGSGSNGTSGGSGPGGVGAANPNASNGVGGQRVSPGTGSNALALPGSNAFGDLPGGSGGNDAAASDAANPQSLPGAQSRSSDVVLGLIIGALLVGLLLAPPLVARRFGPGASVK